MASSPFYLRRRRNKCNTKNQFLSKTNFSKCNFFIKWLLGSSILLLASNLGDCLPIFSVDKVLNRKRINAYSSKSYIKKQNSMSHFFSEYTTKIIKKENEYYSLFVILYNVFLKYFI